LKEVVETKQPPYPTDQPSFSPKSYRIYRTDEVLSTPKNLASKFLLLQEWHQEEHLAIPVVCLLMMGVADEENLLPTHFHHLMH
jgi:hypothetical protein